MDQTGQPAWAFKNFNLITIIYSLIVIAVSIQSLLLEEKSFSPGGATYPQYNNYLIFKQSFYHLIHDQDLYASYPAEQGDLFKYSPAFALLFAPFALLPDSAGLVLWNILNAFCLLAAIRMLPVWDTRTKILALLFMIVELVTTLQNSQSNALMAGMIILAFSMFEKGRYVLAALLITGTVYIKIFGLFAFAIFLFYPNKLKFVGSALGFSILFALLPLLVTSAYQLGHQYESWIYLLLNDHSVSYGISVIGWLITWFNFTGDKNFVVLVGLVLLSLPFLRWKKYADFGFRIAMLSSILIWIVIFNHKAESPTYIIAIVGVALWYFSGTRSVFNLILAMAAFIFTTLSPTDIFPGALQDNFFDPYVIKAVPCIFVWIKITVDSLRPEPVTARPS